MIIYPAIDLRGGRVVRLSEGDFERSKEYTKQPLFAAQSFKAQGATHLHVVDLDGAKDGSKGNLRVIEKIIAQSGLFAQVGGGIRDEQSAARYLDIGASRVILGTALVENPALAGELAARFPGKIAAGVDARDGFVAIHGWREITPIRAYDFIGNLARMGIDTVIYTDIARDGMLMGPNIAAYQAISRIGGLSVIASGGVTTVEDVAALAKLELHGAIIGKALYEGRIDLARAIAAGGAGKADDADKVGDKA